MNRLLFLLCLAAGIFIGANSGGFLTVIKQQTPQTAVYTGSIVPPDIIKANSIAIENSYQIKLDSLAQTNSNLGEQVTTAKSALQQTQHDNKVLRKMVDTLIAHAQQQTDTPGMLAHCDSIETAVQALIATSGLGDSLCESVAAGLQSQLTNRDSSLQVQRLAYNALKLSFDNSLAAQDLLTSQSHWYETQLKKQKINNKLLTAGLAIIAGAATYSFIKH